jgi:hypothetical protein
MSEAKTMSEETVTHEQISLHLKAVEVKVDNIEKNTQDVIKAFNAASGAFLVLEWIAKAVKPIIVIGVFFGAIYLAIDSKFNGVK